MKTDNPSNYTPPSAQAIEDLKRYLIRIETRLVKLMHHMGLDTQGNPHLDAFGDPY